MCWFRFSLACGDKLGVLSLIIAIIYTTKKTYVMAVWFPKSQGGKVGSVQKTELNNDVHVLTYWDRYHTLVSHDQSLQRFLFFLRVGQSWQTLYTYRQVRAVGVRKVAGMGRGGTVCPWTVGKNACLTFSRELGIWPLLLTPAGSLLQAGMQRMWETVHLPFHHLAKIQKYSKLAFKPNL